MNELQQKLARRRSLNGEVGLDDSKFIQTQNVATTSNSKNTTAITDGCKKNNESMATNELQQKLARRRSWEKDGDSLKSASVAEVNPSEDNDNNGKSSSNLVLNGNSYMECEEENMQSTTADNINGPLPAEVSNLESGTAETEISDSEEVRNMNDDSSQQNSTEDQSINKSITGIAYDESIDMENKSVKFDDTEGKCADSGALPSDQSDPLNAEKTTQQPKTEQNTIFQSTEVATDIVREVAAEEQIIENASQEQIETNSDEPTCDVILEVVDTGDSNGRSENELADETELIDKADGCEIMFIENIEANPHMKVSDTIETNAISDVPNIKEIAELETPHEGNHPSEANSGFDELGDNPHEDAWHAGKYQPRLSVSNAGVAKAPPNDLSKSVAKVTPITPVGTSVTVDTGTVASSSKKWNPPLLMARDIANAHYHDFLSGSASTVAQKSIDKQRLRSNSISSSGTEGTSSHYSNALTPIVNGAENDSQAYTEADPIELLASPPTAQRSVLTAELDDIMKLDLDLELDIDNLDIDLEGEIARSRISSTASGGNHITEAIGSNENEMNNGTADNLLDEERPISTRRFGAAAARSYMSYSSSNGTDEDGNLFDDSIGSNFSAAKVTRGRHRDTMYYLGLDDDTATESQIDSDAVSQSLYGLLSDTKRAESNSDGLQRHQQLGLVDHKYLSRSYINSTPLRAGLDNLDLADSKSGLSGSAGDADALHHETDEPKPDMQDRLDKHGLVVNSNAISPSASRVNISKGDETNVVNSEASPSHRVGDDHHLASPQHVALFTEDTKPASNNNNSDHKAMEYQEFLRRFRRCLNLVEHTKKFLYSVLGPNGDTTPPNKGRKLNYVFYGLYKLEERCRSFFDQMQEFIQNHQEFKDEDEERILCARDGLEQYVMYRIGDYAFKHTVEQRESHNDDLILQRRMKLLSFLTIETLDIKPETFNETLLSIASEELRKINAYKTPGDKIACVVKSAAVIFRSLSLAKTQSDVDKADKSSNTDSTPAGADDFLPLFIWVVMKSQVPRLYSNCEYIQAYLSPARLMSKSGYCLINLRSAIEFVMYIDAESLNIDADEFNRKLASAEESLSEIEQRTGR